MKKSLKFKYLLISSLFLGYSPSSLANNTGPISFEDAKTLINQYLEATNQQGQSFQTLAKLKRAYPMALNDEPIRAGREDRGTTDFQNCQAYAKMELPALKQGSLNISYSPGYSWKEMTSMAKAKSGSEQFLSHWQGVAAFLTVKENKDILNDINQSRSPSEYSVPDYLAQQQVTQEHLNTYVSDANTELYNKLAALQNFTNFNPMSIVANRSKEVTTQVKSCIAFAKITHENYENDRYKEDDYVTAQTKKSFDGRLKCKLEGPETIDFDECDSLLTIYNGSAIAIAGNATIQQVQAANFGTEGNMKLMKGAEDPDQAATLALEVQKEGIQKQKSMAHTRQALQTAKLTLMLERAASFPRQDDIIATCSQGDIMSRAVKNAYEVAYAVTSVQISDDASPQTLCRDVLNNHTRANAFLLNSDQLENIYALAAEAGIEVAKETVVATQLGRQEEMIDGVINKVKGAEVLDLPAFDDMSEDQMANYCEANPQAPECLGFSGRTVGSITSPGLNVTTGFGQNELFNGSNPDSDVANPTAITTDDGTNDAITGNRIISETNKDVGFKDSAPGAAKVTSQVQAGGSGGGGGGGASGGALSGGGGPSGQKQGVESGTKRKSKLAYSGGGRKLSFSGGNSRSRNSPKKSGNPFAKIFDKSKSSKNGVLNFRGLASKGVGGKAGNIFDRISNKYSDVSSKDRLLKYEKTE